MRAGALGVRAYAHADTIGGQPRRVSGCTGFWAALMCPGCTGEDVSTRDERPVRG